MFCFILLIPFIKNSNNSNDNLNTTNQDSNENNKETEITLSDSFSAQSTFKFIEQYEDLQQFGMETNVQGSNTNENIKRTLLIEVLGADSDTVLGQESYIIGDEQTAVQTKSVETSMFESNPNPHFDLSIQESEERYSIPLPTVEIKISDPTKNYSNEETNIKEFNDSILKLSEAQKRRIKNLHTMTGNGLFFSYLLENNDYTSEKISNFCVTQDEIFEEIPRYDKYYENSFQNYNYTKNLYKALNLKNTRENLERLDNLIFYNNDLYEKLKKDCFTG